MYVAPQTPATTFGLGDAQEAVNYALAPREVPMPAPYLLVEAIGEMRLYRREGACGQPPPRYDRRFPQS